MMDLLLSQSSGERDRWVGLAGHRPVNGHGVAGNAGGTPPEAWCTDGVPGEVCAVLAGLPCRTNIWVRDGDLRKCCGALVYLGNGPGVRCGHSGGRGDGAAPRPNGRGPATRNREKSKYCNNGLWHGPSLTIRKPNAQAGWHVPETTRELLEELWAN
jgi:hypothetical protein